MADFLQAAFRGRGKSSSNGWLSWSAVNMKDCRTAPGSRQQQRQTTQVGAVACVSDQ